MTFSAWVPVAPIVAFSSFFDVPVTRIPSSCIFVVKISIFVLSDNDRASRQLLPLLICPKFNNRCEKNRKLNEYKPALCSYIFYWKPKQSMVGVPWRTRSNVSVRQRQTA